MRTIIAGLLFACCLLVSSSAWAACPSTLQIKDNAGLTPTAKYTDDGAGNCMANVAIINGGDVAVGATTDIPFVGTGAASVVAILKGLYATGGTTADAAYTGTGSASDVALLKGIYSAVTSPIPGGANVIGGVTATVANGADVTLGSTTDAPCVLPATTAACSLQALAKALVNTAAAALPVGGNVIGGVTMANGANVTQGSTTDAPCTLPASATPCTLIAVAKAGANAMAAALPAGTNLIGKVGIDQTTPGTTNNVTISATPASARHFPGCTVGATSGTCLAASTAVNFLQVQNAAASGGATIACAFGVAAVLNAAGSFQLQPGQSASWGPLTSGVPTGALNCIASAGSTPAFVEWN